MEKVKISVFLILTTLVFLVGSYLALSSYYGDRFRVELVQDVQTSSAYVVRAQALEAQGHVHLAEEVCAWPVFADKFEYDYPEGIEGKDERHQGMWEELSVWDHKLKARGKSQAKGKDLLEHTLIHVPDLMYATDATGEGVAKLTDYSWWGLDISKEYQIVTEVGKLEKPTRDLWLVDGQIVEVTVCPVYGAETKFLGSVIIGWILSDADAEEMKKTSGQDVVFFKGDRVLAGTMGTWAHHEVQREILRAEKVHETKTVASDRDFEIGDTTYLAEAGMFAGYYSNPVAGFMVLGDLDAAFEPIRHTRLATALLGVLLIIILVGGALFVLSQFTKPLVQIDAGIHEVINGNYDFVFPTDDETKETLAGGMAHALNIMSCLLQGKEIPEDEDEAGRAGDWGEDLTIDRPAAPKKPRMAAVPGLIPGLAPPPPKREFTDEPEDEPAKADEGEAEDKPAGDAPAGEERLPSAEVPLEDRVSTAEHQALTAETAETYYKRLFDEYIAARKDNGEPTASITFEKFRDKVIRNEAALRDKLNVPKVRFRVQLKGGKVSLKPIPLSE